jgi:hypothetical protein
MKPTMVRALLALTLFASPSFAQDSRGSRGEDDPVEVLLDIRRELDLTETQVAALRRIQRELEATNRPLVREIMAIQRQVRSSFVVLHTDSGGPGRTPSASELAAARVPLEKIQQNNLAAMERVNALLTSDQKRRAETLLQIRERIDRRPDWMRSRRDRDPD